MTRTNIEIDDYLIGKVMEVYGLPTKREAVDFALRKLVPEPMTREEMLEMRGIGWELDLEKLRAHDVPEW